MSNHIYEQSFSIELTSKLHVTDEFKQKFGMDTLSHYFGNEIEDEDVKPALEDPLKVATLDSKEVLCALAMCNDGFFYDIPKRVELVVESLCQLKMRLYTQRLLLTMVFIALKSALVLTQCLTISLQLKML